MAITEIAPQIEKLKIAEVENQRYKEFNKFNIYLDVVTYKDGEQSIVFGYEDTEKSNAGFVLKHFETLEEAEKYFNNFTNDDVVAFEIENVKEDLYNLIVEKDLISMMYQSAFPTPEIEDLEIKDFQFASDFKQGLILYNSTNDEEKSHENAIFNTNDIQKHKIETINANKVIRNSDADYCVDENNNTYYPHEDNIPKNAKKRFAVEYCFEDDNGDIEEYGLDFDYFNSEEEAISFIENTNITSLQNKKENSSALNSIVKNFEESKIKEYSLYIGKVGVSVDEYISVLKEINKNEEDLLEYDSETPLDELTELAYEDMLVLMEEHGFNPNITQQVMYNRKGLDTNEWKKVEELKGALTQNISEKQTEVQKAKTNRQR